MRQVPHYLIIGNGCVAHHFQHYFSLLKLFFSTWNRQESCTQLEAKLSQCSHILLLIKDQAIDEFIITRLPKSTALHIHFSGSLLTSHAYGAHPLMTFSERLYDLAHYQRIPFVLDHDAPSFDKLLPGLPNPHVRLHTSLKEKYHALCVMSGNFSCILWQKLFATFEQEFNLPAVMAFPYLTQQMNNLEHDYPSALTGPLVRNDKQTIEKNLAALQGDPFQQLYKEFVSCYQSKELKNEYP